MQNKIVEKLKKASYWSSIAIIGTIIGFSLQFAKAWTEPGSAPPGGNVGAPITIGSQQQSRTGNLILNGVNSANVLGVDGVFWGHSDGYFDGNVGIGTTTLGTSKLKVTGVIETTSGGIKFPNGTVQTTAAVSGASVWSARPSGIIANDNPAGNVLIGAYDVSTPYRLYVYGGSGIYTSSNLRADGGMTIGGGATINGGAASFWNQGGEGEVLRLTGSNGVNMHMENVNGTFRLVNNPWSADLFHVDQGGNVGALGESSARIFRASADHPGHNPEGMFFPVLAIRMEAWVRPLTEHCNFLQTVLKRFA